MPCLLLPGWAEESSFKRTRFWVAGQRLLLVPIRSLPENGIRLDATSQTRRSRVAGATARAEVCEQDVFRVQRRLGEEHAVDLGAVAKQ